MGLNDYDDGYDDEAEEVEVMTVTDMAIFAESLRELVSMTIAKGTIDQDALDDYMPLKQVISIVGEHIDGFDEETGCEFLLVESYEDLIEDISATFLGSCLAKLAAADLLETAWDEEEERQVFWRKKR